MIYLDSAATAFHRPPQVEQAICRALHTIGNAGRGAHAPTLVASRMIYETREKLAVLFGVSDPARVIFTANVTQALNTAIEGLIRPGDHVITTVCEHNSVLRPLYRKEASGTALTILPADELGRVDFGTLNTALRPNTRAVVVGHASNLTGNVVDLEAIASFTQSHGLLLIVDAAQTGGTIPISMERSGIDVLCFTGHKGLMGPQGTGGMCLRPGLVIPPLTVGGSGIHSFSRTHPSVLPEALEAGTLNGHGIAGLGGALDYILETGVDSIHRIEDHLARQFAAGVRELPGVTLYGDLEAPVRAPIVTLNIGSADAAEVSDRLWEEAGICVRAGAHCAPLMHQTLGTAEQGAVRFSFSCFNTEEEIDLAIQAVSDMASENCDGLSEQIR